MIISNATNAGLNTLDALFVIADRIERIDPVAIGEKVINITATAAAVIIGVASYIYTALLLWWDDHGQSVIVNVTRFTFFIIDAIGATYHAGRKLRPTLNYWAARVIDRVYYTATAL